MLLNPHDSSVVSGGDIHLQIRADWWPVSAISGEINDGFKHFVRQGS